MNTIQIKTREGVLLHERTCESNTIVLTLQDGTKKGVSFMNANLSGADLSMADLSGADLSMADLSRANLFGANLYRANLSVANLSWADLSMADLSRANLSGADLSMADLSRANLSVANLSWADLSMADLSWADLSMADLSRANLFGANLSGAKYKGITIKRLYVFDGLYKYSILGIISNNNTFHIKMGCYLRTVEEWDKDFWNNPTEFPNNGDKASLFRINAYDFVKGYLKLQTLNI